MGVLNPWPRHLATTNRRLTFLIFATLATTFILFTGRRIYTDENSLRGETGSGPAIELEGKTLTYLVENIEQTAQYYHLYRVAAPWADVFGEVGQRAVAIRKWVSLADALPQSDERTRLEDAVELALAATFPFLADPPNGSRAPFQSLRRRFRTDPSQPGSRGIVIPAGKGNLRMACQAIATISHVLNSSLPIELAYGGDEDLGPQDRAFVRNLFPDADLSFLDVLSVFNDAELQLAKGRWAIKPFALLASRFCEVLLADADAVFVQDPEAVFRQGGYQRKKALMFHDRLIDKARYKNRQAWWRKQVVHPSAEVDKSLSWTEDYAEEGDSGVVAVDKSRLDVLFGMLHAAWQNSKDVRESVTYKVMYGDKESYWFGLELAEGPYEFETHYGGVAGWLGDESGPREVDEPQVCSYVIAHPDDQDRDLLWYNGSLLKNKLTSKREYLVPTHWMIDGTWRKGVRPKFSCMKGGDFREISAAQKDVLERSVAEAKKLDVLFDELEAKAEAAKAEPKAEEPKTEEPKKVGPKKGV
ncbi:unnamed protein product [Parascedosporium putredinis]|uniref:Glycosyltransferase family 71 protein n=1 Tax=Parascedosporium putredinis TaxID=1442378 RepID=A0A9P1H9F4_9PEZI|nr:unnamed protein product [Parascedosporium putredinis]CAI8001842.1 unnamed protein product [Parascedosporium putredinis]